MTISDKIIEALKKAEIISNCDSIELIPVTAGASGAYLFSFSEMIVKYISLNDADTANWLKKSFGKEYRFYELYEKAAEVKTGFVPEIIYQHMNDDEILIVMKKYQPMSAEDWTDERQYIAMDLCAHINALNTEAYENVLIQPETDSNSGEDDSYPVSVSYDNWIKLSERFPEHIEKSLIDKIYEKFDSIGGLVDSLPIPETMCHGDCHPNNFLLDSDSGNENRIVVCDWQGVNVGRGIGDVSFFISRGRDMGLRIDSDKLIEVYLTSFEKHTGIKINIDDLKKEISASNLGISFRFWAEYLQDSSLERILGIYSPMIADYYTLFGE